MRQDKVNCGSTLSSRVIRRRHHRHMHSYNGQLSYHPDTLQRNAIDADVQQLTGHLRSRAMLCIPCGSRVEWQQRAKYLLNAADVVDRINKMLPKTLSVDLEDWNMPTSICGCCLRDVMRAAEESADITTECFEEFCGQRRHSMMSSSNLPNLYCCFSISERISVKEETKEVHGEH